MYFELPDDVRLRLAGHEMMERDAEIARLRHQDVPFRVIAERLRCSVGSVQKAVGRVSKRRAAGSAPVVAGPPISSSDDPMLALLTAQDMRRLRVTAEEVEQGLDSRTGTGYLGCGLQPVMRRGAYSSTGVLVRRSARGTTRAWVDYRRMRCAGFCSTPK
jgi:hypothetical protein